MSSNQQIPPLVQEQLAKLQQTQQNFQSIQMQKQQLESEKHETEKALEELKKASDDESVFKHAGTIMIKSNKKDLIDELEEQMKPNQKLFSSQLQFQVQQYNHLLAMSLFPN